MIALCEEQSMRLLKLKSQINQTKLYQNKKRVMPFHDDNSKLLIISLEWSHNYNEYDKNFTSQSESTWLARVSIY